MVACEEVWLPAKGFEKLCEVSNYGNIRSLPRVIKQSARNNSVSTHQYKGKMLKPVLNNNGYLVVGIKDKHYSVHRIVAKTFLEQIPGKDYVNHKDGNKTNNHVDNLEWCTAKENTNHAVRNNLINFRSERKVKSARANIKKATEKNKLKVNQYDLSGEFIRSYDSIIEASMETNANAAKISRCAKGKQKTCGGFLWEYWGATK